jgi:hypothetical protein
MGRIEAKLDNQLQLSGFLNPIVVVLAINIKVTRINRELTNTIFSFNFPAEENQ